jgi:hypothetical protein
VLLARILLVLTCLGVGSGLDSAAEAAYLVIPKKNEVLASGCCTVPPAGALTTAGTGLLPAAQRPWLLAAYFGTNVGLVVALARYRRSGAPGMGSLLAMVLAASVVSALFLTEVLAPRVLGQPEHHCAYDLVPRFPHLVLGAALFVWGSFSVGWAVVARRLASATQLQHLMGAKVAAMVRHAQLGFVLSMVLISFGLLAAKW